MKAALIYLQSQLNGKSDFMAEWKRLTEEDKETLRRWAIEEQEALEAK